MLLISAKKWIKTLWLLLWDVNDNQVNTKRIKLIRTLTIQVRLFNLWKSLLLFVFVGDLLISVSPKHPTGSKAKITFFDCSSNISFSNSLPLSLQNQRVHYRNWKNLYSKIRYLRWLTSSKYKTILWRGSLERMSHDWNRAFCGKCQNQNNKCLFYAPNSFLSALNIFF